MQEVRPLKRKARDAEAEGTSKRGKTVVQPAKRILKSKIAEPNKKQDTIATEPNSISKTVSKELSPPEATADKLLPRPVVKPKSSKDTKEPPGTKTPGRKSSSTKTDSQDKKKKIVKPRRKAEKKDQVASLLLKPPVKTIVRTRKGSTKGVKFDLTPDHKGLHYSSDDLTDSKKQGQNDRSGKEDQLAITASVKVAREFQKPISKSGLLAISDSQDRVPSNNADSESDDEDENGWRLDPNDETIEDGDIAALPGTVANWGIYTGYPEVSDVAN